MRYQTKCKSCGLEKKYNSEFEPKFCLSCGGELEVMESVKTRMTPRETAEAVMAELDELGPKIDAAYEAYLNLTVIWYDTHTKLQYYWKRGVVSKEEYDKYTHRIGRASKSQSQRLREYRASKKGV